MENQTQMQGAMPMPLIMSFTTPTPILEENEIKDVIYDEINQIYYRMDVIGTRSLRSHTTKPTGKSDPKNEIDDRKNK